MNFRTAVKKAIAGIGDYRGKSSPSEFWLGFSALSALSWLNMLPWPIAIGWGNQALTPEMLYGLVFLQAAFYLYLGATAVPLVVRRLRDSGQRPFLATPFVLVIVVTVLMNLEPYTQWFFPYDSRNALNQATAILLPFVFNAAALIFTLVLVAKKARPVVATIYEAKFCATCGQRLEIELPHGH